VEEKHGIFKIKDVVPVVIHVQKQEDMMDGELK
jgi:hypothetical protein